MINAGRNDDRRDRTKKSVTSLARTVPKPKSRFGKKPSRYEFLKTEIHNWYRAGFEVAEYLREVRTDKLYLGEYESYEEFCLSEFGWKRSQAHALAAWGEMRNNLESAIADTITTESQSRALSEVKESARPAVINRIVKSGEPLTAKRISAAIKPRERKKKEPVIIDVEPEPKNFVKHCATCTCTE